MNAKNKVRFWSEIALSVVTVAVALLFIIEVADIYYSAKDSAEIFSREIVGRRLKVVIGPLVVWIAGIIACFVLSVIYPSEEKARAVKKSERVAKLRGRIPDCDTEEFLREKRLFMSFEKGRYVMYGLASAFAIAVAVVSIVYLADVSRFRSGSINKDILLMVKNIFPWIMATFVFFIAAVFYEKATADSELKAIAKLLVSGKGYPLAISPLKRKTQGVTAFLEKNRTVVIWSVRAAVFVLAVVFIGLGASNGGVQDVLYKAVNICTECIGLG